MGLVTPLVLDKLVRPGPRLPWLAQWLLEEVWSEGNYRSKPPGQYLLDGERFVNEMEEVVFAAANRIYGELLVPVPPERRLMDFLASDENAAAVVFDGLSLREIPLVKKLAEQSGLRVAEEGWTVAAAPSETVDFVADRLGVGAAAPSQLPANAQLRSAGIACHYLGQVNQRFISADTGGALLVWSAFPDYRYKERDAKFPELFEHLHDMMTTAWQNSVQAMLQDAPRRRILATSDHGYVYLGSGCSFAWGNEAVSPLTRYFGGERYARLSEKPGPPEHPGVKVLDDRGVATIRGRVQTHPRGEGARKLYKHGGLSLMEMLVPWLVFEAET